MSLAQVAPSDLAIAECPDAFHARGQDFLECLHGLFSLAHERVGQLMAFRIANEPACSTIASTSTKALIRTMPETL